MLFNIKEEIERMSKLHCQMMESYQKFFDSFTRSIPSGFDVLDGGRKLEDYKEEQCGDTCHCYDGSGNEISYRDVIENDIKSFKWKCCDEDTKVKNILDEIEEERQKRREDRINESRKCLKSNLDIALRACKNDYENELESTKNDPADKELYDEIDKRMEEDRKRYACNFLTGEGVIKYNKDNVKINPNEKFQDTADKIVIKDAINRIGLSMRDQIRSEYWNEFLGKDVSKDERHLSYLALLVKTILRVFGHTSSKADMMYGESDIYDQKFANLVNTIELSDGLTDATARFRSLISPIRLTADECSTSFKSVIGESKGTKIKTWEFKAGKSYFEISTFSHIDGNTQIAFTIEDKEFDKDEVFFIDSKTDFESVFKQIIIHAKNLPETTIKAL